MEPEMTGDRSAHAQTVALESILEVTSDFLYVENVDALLHKIVKTVSDTFGLARASIGIRDKETGMFVVRAAYGFDAETEAKIRKVMYPMERMKRDLKLEYKIGRNAFYVPAEGWEPDEEDLLFICHPERMDRARKFPDEWHELDYIDFLMYKKDGGLLGYLEIDEPDDGKVPSEEKLRAIEIFSDLAAIAIQNAELYEELDKDRKKIELLIDLIAHDVNNYVQAVSGFIELAMSRRGVPEPSRKSMAKAHDQAMNLNKLVSNVKLYAMIESAGDKDLRRMDIVTTIREAFLAAEAQVPNRIVKLTLNDNGKPKMSAMNNLAKEIFFNIFTNAMKFDDHEKVEIDVDVRPVSEEKREMWCVSVADHGPGVEDEYKTDIFERFTKGPRTTSLGTGLGLHIAKTLVGYYKGRIWVEDRVPGDRTKGSVFKVLLPKAKGPA